MNDVKEFTATADDQEVWAVIREFELSLRDLATEVVILRKVAARCGVIEVNDTPSAGVGVTPPAVLLEPLPLEDVPPAVLAEAEARVAATALPIEELPVAVNPDPETQDQIDQRKDEIPF